QELQRWLTEEAQVLAVTSSLAVLDCLQHQIQILEQSVHKRLRHTPSYEQLLTVAGIGPILAQTIALETGAISRFPSVGHYASYCRCDDSNKLSNGKSKGTGNVKNGNPYLAWAYIPTVSHGVTYAAVCTYGCGDGRIAPTRCAVIDAGLDGRSSPHQACKTLPAGAGSAHSALVAGSGLGSPAAPGGSRRSRTTWPSGTTPCGDASLARSALGTHPCPLHSCL